MKKKQTSLCIVFLFFLKSVGAQEQALPLAIDFKNISLEEAKASALKTGKAIFMDVYAVWCIPCKQFEKKVFTDLEVGSKFNELFVNLKIDAEKEEGKKIAKKYSVGGYPTGIFITASGELLLKFEGVQTKENFIEYAENAQLLQSDPHAYEKAVEFYQANKNDKNGVRNLLKKSILTGNQVPGEAMNFYFESSSPKTILADAPVLKKWITTSPIIVAGQGSYQYILSNLEFLKRNLELDDSFFKTLFYSSLQNKTQYAAAKIDSASLQIVLNLNSTLPDNLRLVENIDYKLDYYLELKDLERYVLEMNKYCHASFDALNPKSETKSAIELAERLNTFGWNYFLYADKSADLIYAEKLMQKCIALDGNFAAWYDTYAGIIYKMGNITKAMELENKAVGLSKNKVTEQTIYLSKIERMKKGEKTWLPEQY